MSPSEKKYTTEEFDYRLLDTGNFKKLEQFGLYRFIRPAPQAIWPPSLLETDWEN